MYDGTKWKTTRLSTEHVDATQADSEVGGDTFFLTNGKDIVSITSPTITQFLFLGGQSTTAGILFVSTTGVTIGSLMDMHITNTIIKTSGDPVITDMLTSGSSLNIVGNRSGMCYSLSGTGVSKERSINNVLLRCEIIFSITGGTENLQRTTEIHDKYNSVDHVIMSGSSTSFVSTPSIIGPITSSVRQGTCIVIYASDVIDVGSELQFYYNNVSASNITLRFNVHIQEILV